MWQTLNTELAPFGLTVITVALDKNFDDARPWIEVAAPTHPSLIDTNYVMADLYNMVNVPTVLWIDEEGRIVRPNDVLYVDETFSAIHGYEAAQPIAALRAWVHGEYSGYDGDAIADQPVASADDQLARAHFATAWWLANNGRNAEAEPHFEAADALAPHDFTIRRGAMLMRGKDPSGMEFFKMAGDWVSAGNSYYVPQSDLAPGTSNNKFGKFLDQINGGVAPQAAVRASHSPTNGH